MDVQSQIPKKIHYCWFGGKALGEKEEACVASWRRFLPDYEIVRWDESNFDLHCCRYVEEAYREKKWAFVSDYARFAILAEHGGLYFDTDVEILKPLDDILASGPFMGCEQDGSDLPWQQVPDPEQGILVNPGLGLALPVGHEVAKHMLASYAADRFILEGGGLNQKTVVFRTTEILREFGLQNSSAIQDCAGIRIYPRAFFNPKDYITGRVDITDETRTIHHFSMSWLPKSQREQFAIQTKLMEKGYSLEDAQRRARWFAVIKTGDYGRVFGRLKSLFRRRG